MKRHTIKIKWHKEVKGKRVGKYLLVRNTKDRKDNNFIDKVEFKVKMLNEKKGGGFMAIKSIKKIQWSRSFMYQIISAVTVRNRRKNKSCSMRP